MSTLLSLPRDAHAQRIRRGLGHLGAGLLQFGDQRAQMLGLAAGHGEIAAGERAGDQERPGFDAVGDDRCASAPCSFATPRTRMVEVPAPSMCAPIVVSRRGEIDHFRLARRVLDHGFAASQHGGHQQVFGAGDGDAVEVHLRALRPLGRFGFDVAVLLANFRAQAFEPGDMQIDGTRADGAAAGQRDARAAAAGDQRPSTRLDARMVLTSS